MDWNNLEILITGGCGSLAQNLIKILVTEYKPRGIRLYSRCEYKHASFLQKYESWKKENPKITTPISSCIGDVRDEKRLTLAMKGTNIVIHTAAMKRIEICNDNPIEAIQTNIIGTQNVIMAALQNESVLKIFNISSDKSVLPIVLYGATKSVAEQLITHANVYSQGFNRRPQFYSFRYGNILGSRGSVIQTFQEQAKTGTLTITDLNMTRFFITLPLISRFIIHCVEQSFEEDGKSIFGGEIFLPQMPSCSIMELANIIAPTANKIITGIRGVEKLHETLIAKEESSRTIIKNLPKDLKDLGMKNYFIIKPYELDNEKFEYDSHINPWRMDDKLLKNWVEEKHE